MTPRDDKGDISALASLLEVKGLDASDFIDVINALANIKKRDAAKEEIVKKDPEKKNKIFGDKEFLWETRDDVFIYSSSNRIFFHTLPFPVHLFCVLPLYSFLGS